MTQDITARLAAAAHAPTAVLIAQGPSLLAEAELAIHATRAAAAAAVANLTRQIAEMQQIDAASSGKATTLPAGEPDGRSYGEG